MSVGDTSKSLQPKVSGYCSGSGDWISPTDADRLRC